ncbi:MAG: tRNA 2-thiouridine(34) synthase MnmA [Patescibacteria group bacterium]
MSKTLKKTVYIGLSGGVDSAVSAYLLKKQGYNVKAVFMKNWTGTTENLAGECNWVRERDDAKKVAKQLNIPFTVWDFEREYHKWVVDYFFREYAAGRTPNPDIRCNQYVKIPLFLKRALKEGADYIATGHYCQKSKVKSQKSKLEKHQLLAGCDKNKDQSYFLYTLSQKQLKHLLFPVGELIKPMVRKIAKRLKLPVAAKPDSVGICFIGEVKIADFLRTRIRPTPGPIVDIKGKVLGQHKGLPFYTIGQRHGLGLAGGPWYVVGRIKKSNTLIVGKLQEQKYLLARHFSIKKPHWISGKTLKLPTNLLVCHRYRHPAWPARLYKSGRQYKVMFIKPQRAITPGQSAVFYQKHGKELVCFGGAVIKEVEKRRFLW